MTLKDVFAADAAVGGVFLPTDDDGNPTEFNEIVEFIPEGISAKSENVQAIVEDDAFGGTNETEGDGQIMNDMTGHYDRNSIFVNVRSSVNVRDAQNEYDKDRFVVRGKLYSVSRVMADDGYFKRVLCTRMSRDNIRKSVRVG